MAHITEATLSPTIYYSSLVLISAPVQKPYEANLTTFWSLSTLGVFGILFALFQGDICDNLHRITLQSTRNNPTFFFASDLEKTSIGFARIGSK